MASLALFVEQIALLLVQVSVRDAGKRRKSESQLRRGSCLLYFREKCRFRITCFGASRPRKIHVTSTWIGWSEAEE